MANVLFSVPNTYNASALAGGRTQQNYRLAIPITSFGTDFPEGRCDAIGIEWTAASGGAVNAFAAGSAVRLASGVLTSVNLTPTLLIQSAMAGGKTCVLQIGLNRLGTPTAISAAFYALYI